MARRRLVAPIAALTAVIGVLLAAQPADAKVIAPYRGFATWVDIYDHGLWGNPEATVAAIAARGVRTVYLETANYRQRTAIVRRALVARFLEAAHAQGLDVVAWYLPGFVKPATDLRRSLAAITFETPGGHRFDGFALDIEATAVESPALRTQRLLRVAGDLRRAVGPRRTLGAIIPSPRAMELSPTYWPGFPYERLGKAFDIFLPMVYFTYRARALADTREYVEASIAVLRREVGDPDVRIHVIGGVADRSRPGQVRGFVDAVCADRLLGASLYDFAATSNRQWSVLARLAACVSARG